MNPLSARLSRLESAYNRTSDGLHERYAEDALSYVHDVLGVRHVTPDQAAVLQYVSAGPRCRLLVPSANETGKSFLAACLLSWHYDCFNPSLSLVTAPSQAQVQDIVFRELRRLRRGDPGFSPKACNLADGTDRICKGFTAKSGTAFHGRHDASVLGIFDEAEDVDSEFWEAGESFLDRWVCFYNPTQANSQAAIEERTGKWRIIPMSALNHPNIRCGELGIKNVIPNAVTLRKVLERLDKWAVKLEPEEPKLPTDVCVVGNWYRPGPVAEARVLGRRPTKPVNAVFAAGDLDFMCKNVTEVRPEWVLTIGCDVARFGDDFTTIHVRKGRCSLHHEAHNGWDTVQTAERLIELAFRYSGEAGVSPPEIPLITDEIGLGVGVIDQLRHRNMNAVGVNTSRLPDLGKEDEYLNLRSQVAFDFEELVRSHLIDLSRIDPHFQHDICEQMTAMSYTLGPRGHRIVAPKKDMKEALGRSPDDADAVMLAYYQFPEALEHHGNRPSSVPRS